MYCALACFSFCVKFPLLLLKRSCLQKHLIFRDVVGRGCSDRVAMATAAIELPLTIYLQKRSTAILNDRAPLQALLSPLCPPPLHVEKNWEIYLSCIRCTLAKKALKLLLLMITLLLLSATGGTKQQIRQKQMRKSPQKIKQNTHLTAI